jgi:hypothetical protein
MHEDLELLLLEKLVNVFAFWNILHILHRSEFFIVSSLPPSPLTTLFIEVSGMTVFLCAGRMSKFS